MADKGYRNRKKYKETKKNSGRSDSGVFFGMCLFRKSDNLKWTELDKEEERFWDMD